MMNRQKVKDFFEFKKDNTKLYVGLGIVFLLLGFALFLSFILSGVFFWLAYREKEKRSDNSELEAVRFFKQKDVSNLLDRAFKKANVDIDDLVDFEASDMLDFDELEANPGNTQEKLRRKSFILLGTPDNFRFRAVKEAGGMRSLEINPWRITILFLTQSQLIGYEAELDITRGDLNTEDFHRMFLRDVVQIGTSTKSKRIEIDPKARDEATVEYREMFGPNIKEVVRRFHFVSISKTDGQPLTFPIGVPESRDGTVGALDMDSSDEDAHYMRIAQEMSQRIDEMKRGLPAA